MTSQAVLMARKDILIDRNGVKVNVRQRPGENDAQILITGPNGLEVRLHVQSVQASGADEWAQYVPMVSELRD